jgi:hypothetical protein
MMVAGYAGLQLLVVSASAQSREARELRRSACEVMRGWSSSQALFGAKSLALSQLWALVEECAAPDWNGEQALPLSRLAAQQAQQFICALPDGLPLPEFAPEPDGSISLDWMPSRHRLLSLSIGESDRLPYTWIDGSDRGYAVARFDGERVPQRIVEAIRAVADRVDAGVRAA